jgi:hypothetical protein
VDAAVKLELLLYGPDGFENRKVFHIGPQNPVLGRRAAITGRTSGNLSGARRVRLYGEYRFYVAHDDLPLGLTPIHQIRNPGCVRQGRGLFQKEKRLSEIIPTQNTPLKLTKVLDEWVVVPFRVHRLIGYCRSP